MYIDYHNTGTSQQYIPVKPPRSRNFFRAMVPKYDGCPIPPLVLAKYKKRFHYHLSRLTETQRSILKIILRRIVNGERAYMSQSTMAREIGVHRTTVNKALFVLEKQGLVGSERRPKVNHRSLIYSVSIIFLNPFYARKVIDLLPVLQSVCFEKPFTLSSSLINLVKYKSSLSLSQVYTKICPSTPDQTRLDFSSEKERILLKSSREIGEAIEGITEIQLSDFGKAKLAIFPLDSIKYAHKQLQDFLKKGQTINNRFGLMFAACKRYSPTVDCSIANPILQGLQKKLGFSFLDKTTIQSKETVTYDQKALARKARQIQDRYSYTSVSGSDKASPGDPITPEQIHSYSMRTTGRSYEYPKKGKPKTKPTYVKRDDSVYNAATAKPLSEICDDWEDKWLYTQKTLGNNHPVINKELALRSMLSMIMHNVDNYRSIDLDTVIDYLQNVIFNTPAPESIIRGTIATEKDYYSFLTDLLEDFQEEMKDVNSNNNYTRQSNPSQATQA